VKPLGCNADGCKKEKKIASKCLFRTLTQEIEKIATTVLHAKVFYVIDEESSLDKFFYILYESWEI